MVCYVGSRWALEYRFTTPKTFDAGNPAMHEGDTIYLTTADADGNMVSLIQSNYRGMGSGIVVPGVSCKPLRMTVPPVNVMLLPSVTLSSVP